MEADYTPWWVKKAGYVNVLISEPNPPRLFRFILDTFTLSGLKESNSSRTSKRTLRDITMSFQSPEAISRAASSPPHLSSLSQSQDSFGHHGARFHSLRTNITGVIGDGVSSPRRHAAPRATSLLVRATSLFSSTVMEVSEVDGNWREVLWRSMTC